jgi:PPIC-type PPIASE domain
VKRLIVLLIVLAGGLAAACFAVPSNAATVNGASISQDTFNSDLNAIAGSPDYRCYLTGEEAVATGGETTLPSVDGSGHSGDGTSNPTVSTAFASYYLDTEIGHQLVLQLAAERNLQVTEQELAAARTELTGQITAVLSDVTGSQYACAAGTTAEDVLGSVPASLVDRTVKFEAAVNLLEEHAAGVGSTPADLERYFDDHASEFDTACFTVAQYTSEADATAAAAQVAAGTPFSTVAAQTEGGGPQGCDILYGIASSLPAGSDLQTLPLNTVSSPIAVNSSYLLIEITQRTPTSFAKAKTEVQSAVEAAGSTKAGTIIDAAEKTADVTVDRRYGEWVAPRVLPPPSPPASDLLDPTVTGGTAPAAGQSS